VFNKIPRGRALEVLKFQKSQIPNSKKKQSEAEPRGINPKEIKKCDSFINSTIGYSFILGILGTQNFMN